MGRQGFPGNFQQGSSPYSPYKTRLIHLKYFLFIQQVGGESVYYTYRSIPTRSYIFTGKSGQTILCYRFTQTYIYASYAIFIYNIRQLLDIYNIQLYTTIYNISNRIQYYLCVSDSVCVDFGFKRDMQLKYYNSIIAGENYSSLFRLKYLSVKICRQSYTKSVRP